MNIFPHILCRIGGGSFDEFSEAIYFPALQEIITKQVHLHHEKESVKLAFSERLRKFIEQEQNAKTQNLLQNFRRDIYNDRNRGTKDKTIQEIRKIIPAELFKELDNYLLILDKYKNLVNKGEVVYEQERIKSRNNLKVLSLKDNLQKGLLLSSHALLDQIPKYAGKSAEEFTKKEIKTERSLLQYLTRIYTKTSPFSSFTNLAIGKTAYKPDEIVRINSLTGNKEAVDSHVRLNNYLFKYLKILLIHYRPVYLELYIRPNPTLENKGDYFHYLTNNHNLESFQQISANPVLSLLLTLSGERKEGKKFISLIEDAAGHVNASEDEVEKYIQQLLKYGFLEYDFQVSGLDPDWDVKMATMLQSMAKKNTPIITELIQTLVHIRELMRQYQVATVTARKKILAEAYTNFRSACFKIHEAAGLPPEERVLNKKGSHSKKAKEETDDSAEVKEKPAAFTHESRTEFLFRPEQIFYEDTVRAINVLLDKDHLQTFMGKLNDLLQGLRLFKGGTDEKYKMQDYFVEKYGIPGSARVLDFYQDYYKDVKKPELTLQEERKKMPQALKDKEFALNEALQPKEFTKDTAVPAIVRRQQKAKDWHKQFAENLPVDPGEEVLLNQDFIKNNHLFQGLGYNGSNSFGAFIQFYKEKDKKGNDILKGVLNTSFPGYGKMVSRFLHIFDQQLSGDIRSWNLKLSDGKLMVENCDASYFNANIHPSLMPYEIRMPGANNMHSSEKQLPVRDFELCLDKKDQELKLFHKPSGKEGYVFDLGFQSSSGRSRLFQLLSQFTKSEYLHVYPVVDAVNTTSGKSDSNEDKKEQVRILPRIVYEDQIILQRKSWLIPKTLLLSRKNGETDSGFYFRMNIWRKCHDIPDEVFVFIVPAAEYSEVKGKLQKPGNDDYKPQYINFNNPLLVNLLEKLINKVPESLKVQEMLPAPQQMLHIEGRKFVSEFMVQWYNY